MVVLLRYIRPVRVVDSQQEPLDLSLNHSVGDETMILAA
jgi:hypothetical protein